MDSARTVRIPSDNVKSTRFVVLVALLAIAAAGIWFLRLRPTGAGGGGNLTVYYTKLDGRTLGHMSVSLRPRQAGESDAEHLHNVALYATVQAVAGPPSETPAIRFPAGTRVEDVDVKGSTATVNLSKEIEGQAGGTFGENGEFKALVYTLTAVPGIDAVQIEVEGKKLDTLPGGHLELDQALARSDF